MTREEAYNTLLKLRAWRTWGKGEQNPEDMPEMPSQSEVDKALDVFIEVLKTPIAPEGLGEAAQLYAIPHYMKDIDKGHIDEYPYDAGLEAAFKAGAEWVVGQMERCQYDNVRGLE